MQQQLGTYALQNAQLVEQYDQAQTVVASKQAAAVQAGKQAAIAAAAFDSARDLLSTTIAAQYEGGAFSTTGALLSSDSGQSYLDQLQTLSLISSHNAQVVSDLVAAKQLADASAQQAQSLLAAATAKRDSLAKQRAAVQAQVDKYQALLGTLTASQRAAYQQATNPAVSAATVSQAVAKFSGAIPASAAAAASQAVRFALAQVGKPYVFGAAGPDSYDCSGLTMAAYASAGISLPHSAADQYNYGTHVSFADLQPGDLLFFYQPIGHVTIYIGDGLMVSAPQTGENVSVVPANSFGSSFTGATRLVG